MNSPAKYQPAELPTSAEAALQMAAEMDEWARLARDADRHGSARQLELTSKLLRFFAEQSGAGKSPDVNAEMLAAMYDVVDCFAGNHNELPPDQWNEWADRIIGKVRAAIAKATGSQP